MAYIISDTCEVDGNRSNTLSVLKNKVTNASFITCNEVTHIEEKYKNV